MMVVFLVVFGIFSTVYAFDCPDNCKCSTAAHKNLTVCQEGDLRSIPRTLNPYTNHLDISGNVIENLENRTFVEAGLINLQAIVLKSSTIRRIEQGTFVGLKWLIELDLSNNFIENIHPLLFSDNKLLEMVNFSGNPITRLVPYQFTTLQNLRTLDFRNCALENVEEEAFSNLVSLQTLCLKNNKLTTLPKNIFTWLKQMHNLDLDENPWQCDCNVQVIAILLLIRGLYNSNGTLTCTYATKPTIIRWQDMDHIHNDCEHHVQAHVKETIMSGSPRFGKSTVFKYMNTTRRLPRYSSHILQSPFLPWIAAFLALITSYGCVICICNIYKYRIQTNTHKKNYECTNKREENSIYRDDFCLIDEENTTSDVSVSIDL
ncbi:hypothetical protein PGB90_006850 [Kerria lacca]